MENQNINLPNPNSPITISSPLSPETDKLLRKYLKLQVLNYTWNFIFKIIVIIFFIVSFIIGTTTLLPFLEKQLNAFSSVYEMSQPQDDSVNLNDIIKQFNSGTKTN